MSGFRKNIKRTFTQKDTRSFYLVASDIFYGLIFLSKQTGTYKSNRVLVSNPNLLFYNNQSKVIIDYSNSKNNDDVSFIQSFFNSLTSGVTFEFKNSTYVEDGSNIKSDLSGIYSFTSFEQNKIVKADVVSITNISSKKDSYFAKFFTKTPQLSKLSQTISSSQQKQNIIKNTLSNGLFSFQRMGVRTGDYIEFTGTDENSNKKMKVLELFIDSDGFETIRVDNTINDKNLLGESVLVNLYLTGENKNTVNINDKTYGSCILIYGENNSICLPTQNSFLCEERKKELNAISFSYLPNSVCSDTGVIDLTSSLLQTNQQLFGLTLTDASIQTNFAAITTGITGQVVDVPVYSKPKTYYDVFEIKQMNNELVDIKTKNNELQSKKNVILKIITSDPTLRGYKFTFSSTNPKEKISEIVDNVVNVGIPGESSSYFSIAINSKYQKIYLTSSDKTLTIPITIK